VLLLVLLVLDRLLLLVMLVLDRMLLVLALLTRLLLLLLLVLVLVLLLLLHRRRAHLHRLLLLLGARVHVARRDVVGARSLRQRDLNSVPNACARLSISCRSRTPSVLAQRSKISGEVMQ